MWLMTALIAGAIPLSVSRSGIVTVGVALFVYGIVLRLRTLFNLMPLAFAGVVAIGIAAPGVLGGVWGLLLATGSDREITEARTDDYPVIFAQWRENPVFGRGPGTYIPVLYRFVDNQYLLELVSTGVVGIVVLLSIFCMGYSLARRVRWYSSDENVRGLGQALAAAIAAAAVSLATYDAFSFTVMFVVTHILVGCAGALWRTAVRDCPPLVTSESGGPPETRALLKKGVPRE